MPSDKSKSVLKCLNDTATRKDILGFKPYVEAIAEFLTSEGTLPPITLSIEGEWGCGKSSFMKQLKEEIDKKNERDEETKYVTVWFNSWKYDKEDELWASFALNFIDELSKQLSWKHLQSSRLKLFYLRYKFLLKSNFLIFVHFFWTIISFTLIFLFLSLLITYVLHSLGMPLPDFINSELIKSFSNFILISAPLIGLMKYFSTEKWFIDVFRDPFGLKKLESNTNYKEHLSFREYFHSDLNEIIKSYVGDSKVYVFIDDLDRCEVPKAAELMQAINLMISDNSKVYFSLAINRKIISAGLAAKNKKVIDYLEVEGLEYGYDFIEKFIQLPFKVPSPKSTDFLKFLTSVNETPLNSSEPSEDFTALDESPEGDIRSLKNESKSQDTGSNDFNNVETEFIKQEIQNDKDCVENSEISKQILEMVSPALDNNPRRIKQFINQFRFQKIIGYRIGLFSYNKGVLAENMWNCKKLAKFVAISIKWNSLISALNSNRRLLDQLQEYALKPENERNKLERWTKEEKLIGLLRYGCMEGTNKSENMAEYTLSGLDLSNLLQISPVMTYTEEATFVGSDSKGANFYWTKMKKSILIPIIFTEETNRSISYNMYKRFIRLDKKLNIESYLLKKIPDLKFPLVISLNFNPRNSYNSEDWILAWDRLLKNWNGIDRKLMERLFPNEGFCYHILPHLVLPLAFALGASVNLRRPLVLYHHQNQKFYKVIDLKDPREVSHKPKSAVNAPKTIPEDLNLDGGKKLILHIVISARHVENFQLHEDYLNATNVAIVYDTDLDPKEDWLPYVQEIVQIAKPLIHRYEDVDVCLICPSVVAFALGMAFSRKGSLKVCHWFSDGKYRPVFPLSEIENHPPFS